MRAPMPIEAVAANVSVRVEMARRIMRQNGRFGFDAGSVADMHAVRIGQVNIGPQRNSCISADIVSGHIAQAPCV